MCGCPSRATALASRRKRSSWSESEAISRSSVVAAEQKTRRGRDKGEGLAAEPGPRDTADPAYVADKIPHGLRAAIPPGVRRGLRKAVGRER